MVVNVESSLPGFLCLIGLNNNLYFKEAANFEKRDVLDYGMRKSSSLSFPEIVDIVLPCFFNGFLFQLLPANFKRISQII